MANLTEAMEAYCDLWVRLHRERYPNVPEHARVPQTFTASKHANRVTNLICKWVEMNGGLADRIGNTGMWDGQKFRTSNTRKGIADIIGCHRGRFFACEVKWGRDTQSEHQQRWQADVERAGGVYIIAGSFEEFYEWWTTWVL